MKPHSPGSSGLWMGAGLEGIREILGQGVGSGVLGCYKVIVDS